MGSGGKKDCLPYCKTKKQKQMTFIECAVSYRSAILQHDLRDELWQEIQTVHLYCPLLVNTWTAQVQ